MGEEEKFKPLICQSLSFSEYLFVAIEGSYSIQFNLTVQIYFKLCWKASLLIRTLQFITNFALPIKPIGRDCIGNLLIVLYSNRFLFILNFQSILNFFLFIVHTWFIFSGDTDLITNLLHDKHRLDRIWGGTFTNRYASLQLLIFIHMYTAHHCFQQSYYLMFWPDHFCIISIHLI